MTSARRSDDCEALIDQAALDKVRGHHVFQSGPHFLCVGSRHRRLGCPVRPGTEEKSGLVLIGVNAARIEVITEVRPIVFVEHRFQRGPHIFRSEQIAKSGDIGVPLAEDLIGQAAVADLVLDLTVLVRPVRLHEGVT